MDRHDYISLGRDLSTILRHLSTLPITNEQLQQAELTPESWLERLYIHQDYVDHNEFGMAFEGVVDDLATLRPRLPLVVLALLRSLAVQMQLDASQLDQLLSE